MKKNTKKKKKGDMDVKLNKKNWTKSTRKLCEKRKVKRQRIEAEKERKEQEEESRKRC